MYFWVGTLHNCAGEFPGRRERIQVLSSLAPSSLIVGSSLRTRAFEAGQKYLAESEFGKFTSMEKYAQLLLIANIQKSKKMTNL
jgi:hypothetical protein